MVKLNSQRQLNYLLFHSRRSSAACGLFDIHPFNSISGFSRSSNEGMIMKHDDDRLVAMKFVVVFTIYYIMMANIRIIRIEACA